MTVMTIDELDAYLRAVFPQMAEYNVTVEELRDNFARTRMSPGERHLRPGPVVSGPTMMAFADFSMYVALLAMIGRVPMATTTSFNINFLRGAPAGDMLAETTILKLGKRLAVGESRLYRADQADVVAHATMTYSVPPR